MIVERNDERPDGDVIKTSFSEKDKNKYGPGVGGPSNRAGEAEAQKLNDAYDDYWWWQSNGQSCQRWS